MLESNKCQTRNFSDFNMNWIYNFKNAVSMYTGNSKDCCSKLLSFFCARASPSVGWTGPCPKSTLAVHSCAEIREGQQQQGFTRHDILQM